MKIKPARGMLVVKFLEEPSTLDTQNGIPAIVDSVGPKRDYEEGEQVLLKPYAQFGLSLAGGGMLIDELCVAGTVKENP